MKKNLTKDFVIRFLDCFLDKNDTGIYIADDGSDSLIINREEDILYDEENYVTGTFEGYKWKAVCGASKIAFIFNDFDEVIKIPFCGTFYCDYDEDNIYEYEYDEFLNHIELENTIYRDSPQEIQSILLENKLILKYGNLSVYTQEKVEKTACGQQGVVKNIPNKTRELIKAAQDMKLNGAFLFTDSWLVALANKYEQNFLDIVNALNYEDMHRDNYGYLKDGSPVILDYAGYHSYC